MAGDDTVIVVRGLMRSVEYAIRRDRSMPAKQFFDSLNARDQAYLLNRFKQIADGGEQAISNEDVFRRERKLPDDIIKGTGGWLWAFKKKTKNRPGGGTGNLRISCFLLNHRWILAHGFWKPPQAKWRERDYSEAFAIIREVMDREHRKQH